MKVVTQYAPPPIPLRGFDWTAIDDDTYDGSGPVGYGATEQEAIADLRDRMPVQQWPTFKAGDKVVAAGNPFWLTVKRVLPGGYNFQCCFGNTDRDAGVWHRNELQPYAEPEPCDAKLLYAVGQS